MTHPSAFWLSAVGSVIAALPAPRPVAAAAAGDTLERSGWFAQVSRELQRDEYRFSPVPGEVGAWSAPSRAHGFRSRVSATGLAVSPRSVATRAADAGWNLVLATANFGRTDCQTKLECKTLRVAGARVELDHGRLVEWFVNDERGLEHGWTIASAPLGGEPLWIGLAVEGELYLRIDAGARSGVFVDATGKPRLRYTGLLAFDATGRELDARLAPSPNGVGIAIDDAGAVYPLTVDPTLTGPAWTAEGDQVGAWFGSSVACAGDVNGDGYSDVIIGARTYDHGEIGEGRAFVYLGGTAGLSTSATWTAESDQVDAEFGNSVATAGDVNADGFSDVIVAAWRYAGGQTGEGRAFVYLGSSAGLATRAAWTAESDQEGAAFGACVATAGDVNGDGYSDVVVGASQYDNGESNEGRAFVYLGSNSGLATGAAWTAESDQLDAQFGVCVAPAGDIDADGFDDLLVGADQYDNGELDEGRAFLFRGSGSGLQASADWTTESNQAVAHLGLSVATAGDVDGDGYGDVIVGASFYTHGETSEGRAFVYSGSSSGLSTSAAWTAEGDQTFVSFGSTVATAGDVNGDGYGDVIVAAHEFDNGELNEGRTFVYLGSNTGLSTVPAWTAESNQFGARFGWSVGTAGDVNADGYCDVIVGANLYDNGEQSEGAVFVYMGSAASLATSTAWTAESDNTNAAFGICVATAGDVNGDGFSDVIVGAPHYHGDRFDEGRAWVYWGSAAGLSRTAAWSVEGNSFAFNFGASVCTAGDVNGDGYADVIVGAAAYNRKVGIDPAAFVFLGSRTGLANGAAWTVVGLHGTRFGASVATAGDVNGDGFGDVIVGGTRTGSAFVYHGSNTGLSTSAAWTADGGQPASGFGTSVATAGDVNRDGYGDVIIGAPHYSDGRSQVGSAFAYLGSAAGLSNSAAWTAAGEQETEYFGYSVATAGDVNGDGYSDVIVGACLYDSGEINAGRAQVYLGSATGLGPAATWTAEGDQASALFGYCVATGGDVNGDGYSDVIVAAPTHDDDQADDGRVNAYLGSSTGLAAAAAWTVASDQSQSQFGASVAPAGDVNGDGFSDVIVGASGYDAGQGGEGRTFVYLGNEGRGGWTLAPQQHQADDSAPIDLLGSSSSPAEFGIRLEFPHSPAGFTWASGRAPKARMEWEVKRLSAPLTGTATVLGTEALVNGFPLVFDELAEFHPVGGAQQPLASGPYHWRARVRTNNPLFPVTRWVTVPWNNVTETKLSVQPLLPFGRHHH